MSPYEEIKWWARWFVRYFPGAAFRRVTQCRNGHGWLLDGEVCMTCFAPWFKESL